MKHTLFKNTFIVICSAGLALTFSSCSNTTSDINNRKVASEGRRGGNENHGDNHGGDNHGGDNFHGGEQGPHGGGMHDGHQPGRPDNGWAPGHQHSPIVFHGGPRGGRLWQDSAHRGWSHWNHVPNLYWDRSFYSNWEWSNIHTVTCIAEDRNTGEQYPVPEDQYVGIWQQNMQNFQDDALDYCYNQTISDYGEAGDCYLATCTYY